MDTSTIILFVIFSSIVITIFIGIFRARNKEKEVRVRAAKAKSRRNPPPKLQRESKSPKSSSKSSRDLEWIKTELEAKEENILRLSMGYQFNVPKGHKYDLFKAIKITRESRRDVKVVGILNKVIPSYLDIRPANSGYGTTKDSFIIIDLKRSFNFYSTAPDMWREIFTDENIKSIFLENTSLIKHYYVRGEYLEAIASYDETIISILSVTKLIHEGMKQLFGVLEDYQIEKLVCYNCKDPFDPLEEVCDKCGASRPRCIVCLLDLYPSEIDEDVVTTPCCGVYTHKDHIIVWLKQNPICPNCHENLKHWLGQLQIS